MLWATRDAPRLKTRTRVRGGGATVLSKDTHAFYLDHSEGSLLMRNRRVACLIVFALLACTGTCAARAEEKLPEGKDLTALLEKMQAAMRANRKLSLQYTDEQFKHHIGFDEKGKKAQDITLKYEDIFLGGLPYRRLVELNGKPLSGKLAAEEQARYDKAIAERKGMEHKNHTTLHSLQRVMDETTPLYNLTTLFENRAVRTELLEGRASWVIESTPRADVRPKEKPKRDAMEWKYSIWIDRQDIVPAKVVAEKLVDGDRVLAGTKWTVIRRRHMETIADGATRPVWLRDFFHCDSHMTLLWKRLSASDDERWSNYKKFQVDVRLLDYVEELDDATSGN